MSSLSRTTPQSSSYRVDYQFTSESFKTPTPPIVDNSKLPKTTVVTTHVTNCLKTNLLLKTCRVRVRAPNCLSTEARRLLDLASSSSSISERLAQLFCLPRTRRAACISGIAGFSSSTLSQSVTSFPMYANYACNGKVSVTAVVLPKVTCDLPPSTVLFNHRHWKHLSVLKLADPDFWKPGHIHLLLGVDVFIEVMLQDWQEGSTRSSAFETSLGWVLAGSPSGDSIPNPALACPTLITSNDDILWRFWELEERLTHTQILTAEESFVH